MGAVKDAFKNIMSIAPIITPFDDIKRDIGLIKSPKKGDTRTPAQRFIQSAPGPVASAFGTKSESDRKTLLGK